jgi:hypothetical protein
MRRRAPLRAWLTIGAAALLLVGLAWRVSDDEGLPTQAVPTSAPRDLSAGYVATASAVAGAPPGTVAEKLWLGAQADDPVQRLLLRQAGTSAIFASQSDIERARAQSLLFAPVRAQQDLRQSPLANPRRLNDGRLWMDYNMLVLASRVEGDRFVLPLPGMPAVEGEIDSVELVNGHYRWSGRILGMDLAGRFSITQAMADQYAVGSFDTGQGEFLLEAKGGLGWVAHTSQEFQAGDDGLHDADVDGKGLQH